MLPDWMIAEIEKKERARREHERQDNRIHAPEQEEYPEHRPEHRPEPEPQERGVWIIDL